MNAPDRDSKRIDDLEKENESLRRRWEKLLDENERLRKDLEEALRGLKR